MLALSSSNSTSVTSSKLSRRRSSNWRTTRPTSPSLNGPQVPKRVKERANKLKRKRQRAPPRLSPPSSLHTCLHFSPGLLRSLQDHLSAYTLRYLKRLLLRQLLRDILATGTPSSQPPILPAHLPPLLPGPPPLAAGPPQRLHPALPQEAAPQTAPQGHPCDPLQCLCRGLRAQLCHLRNSLLLLYCGEAEGCSFYYLLSRIRLKLIFEHSVDHKNYHFKDIYFDVSV